jgi:hypothetical protein
MEEEIKEEVNQEKKVNTEILTLISKEKFRRAMLISSRIIAVFLIFAIVYMGFIQMQYGKFLKTKDACYICGYNYGKQCNCVYISDLEKQFLSENDLEAIKLDRAKYNSQVCRTNMKVNDALNNNEIILHPSMNLT